MSDDKQDDKQSDEQPSAEDANKVTKDQLPAAGRGRLKRAGGNVEVPADALHEAVGQLKQLTALRQQENERQEQAIGAMQAAMQSQRKTNGWMVVVSLVLLAVAGAGIYYFLELRDLTEAQSQDIAQVGQQVNAEVDRQTELLSEMGGQVEATRQAVEAEVGRQVEKLVGIEQVLGATRSEQAERLSAVEAELTRSLDQAGDEQLAAMASVREAVEAAQREQAERLALANEEVTRTVTEVASGQAVALVSVDDKITALRDQLALAQDENAKLQQLVDEKIRSTEDAITERVQASVAAVRAERDQVVTEMGRLLEERMAQLDARESELESRQASLAAEEDRFNQEAAASRERMRTLLNDALQSLAPSTGSDAVPPVDSQSAQAAAAQGTVVDTPAESVPQPAAE